ncbi:peroxisomal acyl-coenzyme A oxidase 1-like [Glandiceps talaboti]
MPINPDIQRERENATFPVDELTHIRDGGKGKTVRRRHIESLALNDHDFDWGDRSFLTRDEEYSLAVKHGVLTEQKIKEHNIVDENEQNVYRGAVMRKRRHGNALGLHILMFIPTIKGQGTEEQQRKWLPLAESMKVIGTYSQTELGHGTFIRGLETTATYIPEREEFVLHSPKLTSLKWWPGSLGKTVNYSVVMAQLCTKGKCYGVHPFLVQLRSLETHQPLKGVTVGDIGPKFGFNSSDNGFLGLDHVSIPRTNMLMKFAKVLPDGTYVKPPRDKLAYGSMMYVRVAYLGGSAEALAMACTVAIRYSAVRRQSEMTPGGREPQVLDYQSQQLKLFPQLATVYAFYLTEQKTHKMYLKLLEDLGKGEFNTLQDMHALTSGLKAFVTSAMSRGIEVCRLSCGGHGYSHASGLPDIYTMYTHFQTAEGENTVLLLQTARYLMKSAGNAMSGGALSGQVEYLSEAVQENSDIKTESDVLNLDLLLNAYKHRSQRLVMEAARKFRAEMSLDQQHHVAWNKCHIELLKAATAHIHYFIVEAFKDIVQATQMSSSVNSVLNSLCQLYAIHGIHDNAGDFLQDGYLSADQLAMVTHQMVTVFATLRPNAVSLVDAFDFPDGILASSLGTYDGNVYEKIYQWAKQSPLNRQEVHDSYKYLQPMLTANSSKL